MFTLALQYKQQIRPIKSYQSRYIKKARKEFNYYRLVNTFDFANKINNFQLPPGHIVNSLE